jgi:hydroxyethylthiazole kinase-like uncharacterized protein yjeF
MPSRDQILTVAQMRAAEDALIGDGSSVEALMALAGRGVADWVWRVAGRARVTVLCGPGNNGGDGYVVAQVLREREVEAVVVAGYEPRTPAARDARSLFEGDVVGPHADCQGEVLVDCLFGSGLSRALSGADADLLTRLAAKHRLRIAVDVPSGVDADSGALLGASTEYDLTIALGAWKPGHFLMPAAAKMGELKLVGIGIEGVAGAAKAMSRPKLERPEADAHKYTRGLVAVVGGAMPGAAALASEAASRAGAGYVRLSAPTRARASHAIVQSTEPDFAKAKAVLVGPGLGRDEAARAGLGAALASGVPVVADADALWLMGEGGRAYPPPAIATPHEGEFVRAFGDAQGSKIDRARSAAVRTGQVIVYKGADTVIAAPDGPVVMAPRASSWLSTAGTGDVLAGLCAARLAVTGNAFEAGCEAVWLHAEAARLAGAGFVADDLILHIPAALESCL